MELRQLRYFITAASTLNFSKAAECMFISQSTLSEQILALEQELNTTLFDRSHRRISLTSAGRALLSEANHIIKRADDIPQIISLHEKGHDSQASLFLMCETPVMDNDSSFMDCLIKVILSLKQALPELDFSCVPCSVGTGRSALSSQNIDIMFSLNYELPKYPGFHSEIVSTDKLVLVVSRACLEYRNGISAVELLNKMPLLAMDGNDRGLNGQLDVLAALNVTPNIRFLSGGELIDLSISIGAGLSIMPQWKFLRLAHKGLVALPLGVPEADVSIIATYQDKNKNPLIQDFLSQLKCQIKL